MTQEEKKMFFAVELLMNTMQMENGIINIKFIKNDNRRKSKKI